MVKRIKAVLEMERKYKREMDAIVEKKKI